jgi:ribonuclease BN (tRNA processing enzyme)
VAGAFLQGKFQHGEEMYMEVPSDGMEQYYGSRKDVVLRMKVPIYGTKQAAEFFYKELVKKSKEKGYERTNADFTLFKSWTEEGHLLVFAVWVDDIIAFGTRADLDALKADITSAFEAKAELVFNEYVGDKIDINRGDDGIATVKLTQPVLIQKLEGNHTPIMSRAPKTLAVPGSNLCKGDGTDLIIDHS